jgi:hypothetical protein
MRHGIFWAPIFLGTDVMISKNIFAEKNGAKNWRFLLKPKLNYSVI